MPVRHEQGKTGSGGYHGGLEPIKKVTGTIKDHLWRILNAVVLGVLGTFRPKVTLISTAHTPQGLQRWLNFHFARLIA